MRPGDLRVRPGFKGDCSWTPQAAPTLFSCTSTRRLSWARLEDRRPRFLPAQLFSTGWVGRLGCGHGKFEHSCPFAAGPG